MISVITIKKNGLDEIAGDLRLVNAGFPVLNSKILGLIMPKMLVAKRLVFEHGVYSTRQRGEGRKGEDRGGLKEFIYISNRQRVRKGVRG